MERRVPHRSTEAEIGDRFHRAFRRHDSAARARHKSLGAWYGERPLDLALKTGRDSPKNTGDDLRGAGESAKIVLGRWRVVRGGDGPAARGAGEGLYAACGDDDHLRLRWQAGCPRSHGVDWLRGDVEPADHFWADAVAMMVRFPRSFRSRMRPWSEALLVPLALEASQRLADVSERR